MVNIPINCNVFEKPRTRKPAKFANEIESSSKAFLERLQRTASEDFFDLRYHILPLPGSIEGTPETEESLKELSEPKYDADFAICFYPDVNTIGLEMGYLVNRTKKEYRHLFVVTEGDAPDQDATISTLKQISQRVLYEESLPFALPADMFEEQGRTHLPLSFWRLKETREKYTRKRMLDIITLS